MSRFIQEIRTGSNHEPVTSFVSRSNLTVLNPFVLWDHFAISGAVNPAGFGFHGHSGVATISYPLISSIKHEDTGGHTGHLLSGGIQVMSAGGGVLHKETVYPDAGKAEALQLWTLLPTAENEMGPVTYSAAQSDALPEVKNLKSRTKVLVGEYQGVSSPVQHSVAMAYLHVNLKSGSKWQHQVAKGQTTAFVYLRSGQLTIGTTHLSAGEMGIFNTSNDEIQVSTTNNAAEFLLVAGKPLAQPIISTGPSVHSSRHNAILGSRQINKLQMQLTH
jgi:redox-sensitive bicupin YhaK (pirin superfamily)